MNHIILFSNIKGGVGKTTLCAHFCEYLTMKGFHVTAGGNLVPFRSFSIYKCIIYLFNSIILRL